MNDIEQVAKKLAEIEGGAVVIGAHRRDRPDLIFFKKDAGFYAIELCTEDESTIDCGKRLADKCRQLRIAFPELAQSNIEQIVVDKENNKPHTIGAATGVTSNNELSNLVADFGGKKDHLPEETVKSILTRLQPAMTFQGSVRLPAEDEGARDRALMRLALDDTQAKFASLEAADVLKIIGPPGSGKTLVLIARAKLFATEHPDWVVQFVAYNKSLAGYLENQFFDFENIHVATFYNFAEARGHKASAKNDGEDKYFNQVSKNVQRNIDALFIDEYQDFRESWMIYCMATVKLNRGGITIAGDSKQAIYRFQPPDNAFADREVSTVLLNRPYRSTRQILEVASRVDPEFETEGITDAPEGQTVNLVFAESWDAQADYIAWEISKMLKDGQRKATDIAVLGATWSAVLRLRERLERKRIKYAVVAGRHGVDAPEWGKVTLTTIHSAKGYEFDVVFLMAVEALPEKEDGPEAIVQRRGAYVGPTRARDELFITYTRRNDIIDKLHDAPTSLISPWTWPDDFKESK